MSTFSIVRAARTAAPAEHVLTLLHDFRQWVRWSPWEGLDPDLQRAYTGPETGVGSSYAWSGNKKAGAGRMMMLRADERGCALELAFTKPFTATNEVTIDVTPATDGGRALAWTMTGEQGLFGRLFYRLFPMEKMLAKDFDKGLAQLGPEADADADAGAAGA